MSPDRLNRLLATAEDEAKRQDIKVLVETDDMALIDGLDPALGSDVVISNNSELDDDTPVKVEGKSAAEDKPGAPEAKPAAVPAPIAVETEPQPKPAEKPATAKVVTLDSFRKR